MTTATEHRYIASLEEPQLPEDAPQPVRILSVRAMKEALARHRLFWMACALLGLLIGAAFHLIIPAKYTAITTLYLSEPTFTSTYTVADDVNLLETNTVAYRALEDLHLNPRVHAPTTYEGLALGSVLLQVKADGSTPAKAVQWARALDRAFLSVRRETLDRQTQLVVRSLQAQATALTAQVHQLNDAIGSLSTQPTGSSAANQVAQMVSERGTDETQLTNLQNSVQQDLLEQAAVDKGSYVLDPPEALPVHTKKIFAEDGLSGLVAGLAIGAGGVVVAEAISDRPRRRAEIAALLGAPVKLNLSRVPELRRHLKPTRRSSLRHPSHQLRLAQRRLRNQLSIRSSLALVGVGSRPSRLAAVLLASTAFSLATEGKRVVLVDLAEGRPIARLFRLRRKKGPIHAVTVQRRQITVAVAPPDPLDLDPLEATRGADAVLILANANPAVGLEHLTPWCKNVVVLLRAGEATDLLLDATGMMLREAAMTSVSAILLDADEHDETYGAGLDDCAIGQLAR